MLYYHLKLKQPGMCFSEKRTKKNLEAYNICENQEFSGIPEASYMAHGQVHCIKSKSNNQPILIMY